MKKLIAYLVLMTMCVLGFAACSNTDKGGNDAETVSDLVAAKDYLYGMYREQTEATPADYTVVGVVNISGNIFNIEWTVDNAAVKVGAMDATTKMVTIDVDDKNPEEVSYKLTATLTDAEGNKESVSFAHRVPAAIIIDDGMSYADIVDAAYTLEDGLTMDGTFRLFGTITKIDTAWSDQYKNITVTIAVAGKEDKPIMCYRLKGDGAESLKVGDAITVEGILKNYKGTIEFDAGCVLVGMGERKDQSKLLEAAYALEDGLAMNEPMTLTGVISKIDTAWSDQYKNITVTIICDGIEDKPIMCYRLQGEGAADLKVGDTITVTGTMKNYKGTIEFDAKCNLDALYPAAGAEVEPTAEPTEAPAPVADVNEILDLAKLAEAAYKLEQGASYPAATAMKGVITSVDTAYSEKYGNVTVTIDVAGKAIQCFRLKGEGAATIAVGDEIAVVGTLTNYNGKIQYNAGCLLVNAAEFESVQNAVAAYALGTGAAIEGAKTMTGVITEVNSAYSEKYGNVTVTIVVAGLDDYKIECFRLKGEGADTIAVGDTITVTGNLKDYNGKKEFDANCTLDKVVKAAAEAPAAGAVLNVSELTATTLVENTAFGAFTAMANADKSITIDANKKVGDNGMEFTQRLKFGGTGDATARNITFTTAGAAKVTVYAMSSSSGEDRTLVCMTADGATEVGNGVAVAAAPETGIPAIVINVPAAGTYYLASAKSGINIYYIVIE